MGLIMTVDSFLPVFSDFTAWIPLVHGGAGDGPGGGIVGWVEILLERINGLIESGAAFVLFPGIRALAMNVHPMVVHFPIAFLSAFFLLDIIGVSFRRPAVRQVASWMLYLGAFGAVTAAAAGLIAAGSVPHGESVHEVMEWHQRLMLGVSALAVVLAVWRAAVAGRCSSTMAQGLHLFLATLMITLMVLGTDLGGLMVYQHGVGVASLQSPEELHRHAHTSPAAPAVEDRPVRAAAPRE